MYKPTYASPFKEKCEMCFLLVCDFLMPFQTSCFIFAFIFFFSCLTARYDLLFVENNTVQFEIGWWASNSSIIYKKEVIKNPGGIMPELPGTRNSLDFVYTIGIHITPNLDNMPFKRIFGCLQHLKCDNAGKYKSHLA